MDTVYAFDKCPNWDLFKIYETVTQGIFVMGNNKSCWIAGIDKVRLKLVDETSRILDNIQHILNLKKNLISLSTLNLKRYMFYGRDGVLMVWKGACVAVERQKRSQLYILQG